MTAHPLRNFHYTPSHDSWTQPQLCWLSGCGFDGVTEHSLPRLKQVDFCYSGCLVVLGGDTLSLYVSKRRSLHNSPLISQSISNNCIVFTICQVSESRWYLLNPDLSASAGSAVVVLHFFSCSLQVTQFAQHALFPDGLPAKHNSPLCVIYTGAFTVYSMQPE